MKKQVEITLKNGTSHQFSDEWYNEMAETIHKIYTSTNYDFSSIVKGRVLSSDIQHYIFETHGNMTVSKKKCVNLFTKYLNSKGYQFERKNSNGVRYFHISL